MIRKLMITTISLGLLMSCGDGENASDQNSDTPSGESRNLEQDSQKSEFLRKKVDAGIDFYAVGHEPEWVLDVEMAGHMNFKALGEMEMNHPAVEGQEDGGAMRFTSQTEMGKMEVVLKKPASNQGGDVCTDTMSGEEFEYRVEVKVQPSGSDKATTYTGCGTYLSDPEPM
ncbi:MAG: hypothetical protein LC664_05875 [Flavobacteriales bacterium]|nr:hypothetical protein [Flavobacteriales bacterium]